MLSSLILGVAASDREYYSDRSGVIGFQDFKSNRPNKVLPTLKEQMQSYRMAFYNIPLNLSPAKAAQVAKWYKDAGFNMVLAEQCRGLIYDLVPEIKATDKVRPLDLLIRDTKTFFDAARAQGMQTMHHVTCTMVPSALLKKNPQWAAINLNNGKTEINWYGTGNTCINNDEFWNLWFSRLERLLKESPADAVMIDEIQFFGPQLCGCNSCRAKFKADTGYELPPNGKFSGWSKREPKAFRRWRAWRIEKILARQQECRKLLKKLNSKAVFSGYLCNILTGYTYYAFGTDILNLRHYIDSVGLESMPASLRYPEYYPLVMLELKLLRAVAEYTGNAPWVLFYAQDNFSDMAASLSAFATGTRQWWFTLGKKEHVWRPMVQWELEHEELVTPNENGGNIALLFSSLCRNNNPFLSGEWEFGFSGLGNALTDQNTPYRVVTEVDFADAAALRKKADTVVAMNAAVWPKKALAELEKFVRNGGTFITSGNFSMADDQYNKFTDFAAAKLLGFHYDGEIKSASAMEVPEKNPVTGNFTGKIAYDKRIIKLKNIASDVKVLGSFIDKAGKSYPGILLREVGKGRIIYFAGSPERCTFFHFYNTNKITPGQYWNDMRNPQWSALLSRIVKSFNDKVFFEADNFPAGVVVEGLKHKNGDTQGTMLTLINFQSNRAKGGIQPQLREYDFPSAAENRPDKSKPMTLDIFAPGTEKVYLFSMDFDDVVEWAFEKNGDRVKVEIPEVDRHLVVYLSSGSDAAFALPGRKIVKEFPAAKPLLREVLPALAAPRNPESVTEFSDGKNFSGGVLRGTWFQGEPIRIIYGSRSGKTEMTVTFQLEKIMEMPILELGATCDDIINSRAPITIELDGVKIFSGKAPFPDHQWAVQEFSLPVGSLAPGKHTVKITNTGNGPLNNVPWLGVAFCRLKPSGKTLDVSFDSDSPIPLSGKYIRINGRIADGGVVVGDKVNAVRIPAKTLVGEQGAVAVKFRLLPEAPALKGDHGILYLRPASLASLSIVASGNPAKLSILFWHPVKNAGTVVRFTAPLEPDKEYVAAAVWKDRKLRAYVDGQLIKEGVVPLEKVKFNDLFLGPFKDSWFNLAPRGEAVAVTGLRTWNLAPPVEEIFPPAE